MSGRRNWSEIRSQLRSNDTENARYGPMRRATEDAVRLGQLRETRAMTQSQVANTLGSSQANISKLEHRDDLYLSTLSQYVAALGGRLELRAVFPDQTITIEVGDQVEATSEAAAR